MPYHESLKISTLCIYDCSYCGIKRLISLTGGRGERLLDHQKKEPSKKKNSKTNLAWEGNERGRCKGSVRIDSFPENNFLSHPKCPNPNISYPFPENHSLSHPKFSKSNQIKSSLLHPFYISLPTQHIFEVFFLFLSETNVEHCACGGKFPVCWRLFWGFVSTLIQFFS